MDAHRSDRPRRTAAPLYDARFEHDACGVGFVADAGGRSRDRVLPLALAGLASLGHRGAFGADGESSDGAGVALPLDRSLLALLAGDHAAARPGIVSLFLPRGRAAEGRARALVEDDVRRGRTGHRRLARGPDRRHRPRRLGRRLPTRLRPGARRPPGARRDDPRPISDDAFERRLVIARRRLETAARAAGGALAELSVPSASRRTIVYKGLVIGGRLPDLYPDLRAPLSRRLRRLPPALRHEHASRLAARPAVPLDRPQRRDQHGPRQSRAGPRPGGRHGHLRIANALLAAGPLLSPDGSDSLSLDEALELLTATGWDLTPALLTAIPEALALRRASAPARRDPAPPDRRVPRAVGRAGRDRLRRRTARRGAGRPQRSAARGVRGDARPARRRRLGGRGGAVQRGRDRPPRPSRTGRAAARRAGPASDPRGRRGQDAGAARPADPRRAAAAPRGPVRRPRRHRRPATPPTTSCATWPASTPSAPGSTSGRWPSRATSRSGAWATTRRRRAGAGSTARSPITFARPSPRSPTRRSTRSASASSWISASSSGAARRSSAVRPARLGRPASTGRSWSIWRACCRRSATPALGSSRSMRRGIPAGRGRPGRRPRSPRRRDAVAASRAWCRGARRHRRRLVDRSPADPVDPRDRRRPHRPDRCRPARPDRPRGQRGRRARRPRDGDGPRRRRHGRPPAAGDRARRRARRDARRRGADARPTPSAASSPRSRPACARPSPGWASARSRRTSAARSSTSSTSTRRSWPAASRPPPPGPAGRPSRDLAERQIRRRTTALAIPEPAAGREPRLPDPGFARFRADGEAPPLLAADRRRDPGPGRPVATRARRSTSTAALARYRTALARPATERSVPRDELRTRPAAVPTPLAEVEDARVDRPPLRRLGDERRRAEPRGPPGADDRHPAGRRLGQHRRRRRGPGLVRSRARTAAATTPGSSRSRRPGSA